MGLNIEHTAQENLSSDNKPQCSFDKDVLDWISKNCPDWNNADIRKTRTYMIPPTFPNIPKKDNKGDLTEKHVFDILEEFGNKTKQPMFVVHSHKFSELFQKLENGTVRNSYSWDKGETDFVIIHRKLGVIFFQVKAADKTTGAYGKAEDQLIKDQTALTCALKRLTSHELDTKLKKEEENKEEEKNKQLGLQEPERKREKKKCNELERRVEKEMNVYPGFVVMPNCSRDQAGERKGCFKEDIQTVEHFKKWWEKNMHREEAFSQDMYKLMAIWFVGPRVLNECCLLKYVTDKTHKRLILLTESQLRIMTQDVPKQDIVGPAGSGKTWLLLEKARQLAGELKDKERILIMCFNKPLSVYLTTEFKEFKSKVVIKTFVSMLMEITGEKLPVTDAEKTKLVSKCVQKLNQKSMQAKPDPTYKDYRYTYEHVFVDEGQDMFGEWTDLTKLLKLLHADSHEERRYRWVFFDNNQSVHSQNNIPEKIINNAKQMTENVRNTLNIFECSQKFLSPTVGAKLGHGISGLPVKWIDSLPTCTHLSPLEQLQKGAELVTLEIDHLDSKSVARPDIVVLTNNTTERDKVCTVFRSNNILTQNAEEAILSPHNAITVDSIRRFKGLERKVVILLDPPIAKKWHLNYVAMSRCFCLLIIVTSQEKKREYEKFTLDSAKGGH